MFQKKAQLKSLVLKLYEDSRYEKGLKRGELTQRILQEILKFNPKLISSKYPKDIINRYIRNANAPTLKRLSEEVKTLSKEVKELRAIVQSFQKNHSF